MGKLAEMFGSSVVVVMAVIYSVSHISGAVFSGLRDETLDLALSLVVPGYGAYITVDYLFLDDGSSNAAKIFDEGVLGDLRNKRLFVEYCMEGAEVVAKTTNSEAYDAISATGSWKMFTRTYCECWHVEASQEVDNTEELSTSETAQINAICMARTLKHMDS